MKHATLSTKRDDHICRSAKRAAREARDWICERSEQIFLLQDNIFFRYHLWQYKKTFHLRKKTFFHASIKFSNISDKYWSYRIPLSHKSIYWCKNNRITLLFTQKLVPTGKRKAKGNVYSWRERRSGVISDYERGYLVEARNGRIRNR